MSNLPSWISVEEHMPEDGQHLIVHKEYQYPDRAAFAVIPAIYISDVGSTIAEDKDFRYMFSIKEIENTNTNSGFFSYDDYDGTYYMSIIYDVEYWMPTYGVCDTATNDQ